MSDLLERMLIRLVILLVILLGAIVWAFVESPLARWWRGEGGKKR